MAAEIMTVGIGSGTLRLEVGGGALSTPSILQTFVPPVLIGPANEGTVTWDVSALITTFTAVQDLKVVFRNNGRERANIDHVFVEVVQASPDTQPVPPNVISTPVTEAVVGQPYTYQPAASGTAPTTWALVTAPPGMNIDGTTGLVTWTPTDPGTVPVQLQASNAVGSDLQSFSLTVLALTPPTITSVPATAATLGQTYTYQPVASGSPTITWALLTAPPGMTINGTTGLVTWTPAAVGSEAVHLQATNGAGSDTQSFSLTVSEGPTIISTPPTEGSVGGAYTYQALATGTQPITWALVTGPAGMSIAPGTGLLTWTPDATGNVEVQLQASNVAGAATQSFTLAVHGFPIITSAPITQATVGQAYTYQAAASGTQPLTWAVVTPAQDMTIDSSTGLLSWTPLAEGPVSVQVQVFNAAGDDAQSFTITVIPEPQVNQPPIVSVGANQTITLPATANLNGTVIDDGLPIGTVTTTWSQVSGPGTVTFGNIGAVSTTASFNLEGTYVLRLTASDSELTAFADITITVNVVDTTPPVITLLGNPEETVEVGTPYTDAGATALDGLDGDLTSSIETGGLPIDTNGVASYTITYDVSDLSGNAAPQVTRIVHVVDTTPPDVAVNSPITGALVSGSILVTASALDNVAVSLVQFVINGTVIDTDTSLPYSTSWDTTSVNDGTHAITVRAIDDSGNIADHMINVTVSNALPSGSDFRTQLVKVTIPAGSSSVDTSAFNFVQPSRTVALISGITQHAMGWTSETTQDPSEISAYVNLSTDGTTLTATRTSSINQSNTVWVLLVEYTGLPGGANELLVRDRRVQDWTGGQSSITYGPIGSIVNGNKVVVFGAG